MEDSISRKMDSLATGDAVDIGSRLMTLPPELRNRIYEFASQEPTRISLLPQTSSGSNNKVIIPELRLLRSCRQVRLKALPIFKLVSPNWASTVQATVKDFNFDHVIDFFHTPVNPATLGKSTLTIAIVLSGKWETNAVSGLITWLTFCGDKRDQPAQYSFTGYRIPRAWDAVDPGITETFNRKGKGPFRAYQSGVLAKREFESLMNVWKFGRIEDHTRRVERQREGPRLAQEQPLRRAPERKRSEVDAERRARDEECRSRKRAGAMGPRR